MQSEILKNNCNNYAHLVMNELINKDNNIVDGFKEVESYGHGIDSFTNFKLQENLNEKVYNELTYKNTKNMSSKDVDNYFTDSSISEKRHINFMIRISNNFSKNDNVNEAIFEEARFITEINDKVEFSLGLALEKENFLLGVPALHDVLILSDEWISYCESGGKNGAKDGVFMNEQHKARYESDKKIKYNEILLSQEEATDFLITMVNLSKDNYSKSRGTEFDFEYEDAYERYSHMYETYVGLLLT